MRCLGVLVLALSAGAQELPGTVIGSWVGNSFPGLGPNGQGKWVQNYVDEIEVTPNGTIVTASTWDEAGRCAGLYRDGDVNSKLLQQFNGRGGHKAWGWGTAGRAVAVAGDTILLVNTEGELLRFRWTPEQLDSASYVDQIKVGPAIGLAARDQTVALVEPEGTISVRKLADLAEQARFQVEGATDLVLAADGTLWVLAGELIQHWSAAGVRLPGVIEDAGQPSAVACGADGRLVVCDDGPRQQVRVYDITDRPRLSRTFGREGGLRAGTPGEVAPDKLYGLRGAGIDRTGNLYVALSFPVGPSGRCVLRSFDPAGALRWELQNQAFVDCFTFDPAADGLRLVGCDQFLELDPSRPPGQEWRLTAVTYDPHRYPEDPRRSGHRGTAFLRRPRGRTVVYTIGQMAGGFNLYATEPEPSLILRPVGRVGPERDGGWAWQVDLAGDIWRGDAPGRQIERYRCLGWNDDRPAFATAQPDRWPWPEGFTEIGRVHYVPATDTLYVAGYTADKRPRSWGLIGSVIARYDGWTAGQPVRRWLIDTPVDGDNLHPKCLDVAGDYVFVVQVKPTAGIPAQVTIFAAATGALVGRLSPGPTVGGNSGWVDMTHGLQACRRADGEYLILVEEDWRGKNLLYRWRP